MGKTAQNRLNMKGFTLVELMVATSVFAVVLIVCAVGLLQVGRTYYKGVTVTKTQEVARAIMDDVTGAVEYSSVAPSGLLSDGSGNKAYCVGNTRFSFRPGQMLNDAGTNHVFVADTPATCTGPLNLTDPALSGGVNPRELLSPRMRVSKFTISGTPNRLYTVNIRLVNGEDDLLSNPTGTNANCSGVLTGAQFCAAIELSSIVQKRVQ